MRSEAPIDGRADENDAAGWRFGADDLSTCGSLALLLISAFLLNAFVFPRVALVFPAGASFPPIAAWRSRSSWP
ncbi:hypothetical protein [Eggerthella sinensis]|uniref:hypothetical protein n=1 Tax=Eggerthella sinensis TaxID=242230 RepID=UPI0022E835F4|nr:hypothetical protein [Eggerthella sinensis]